MARLSGSSDLFHLIKSLSSEEKGYFVKYAKRHSEGGSEKLNLFHAIDEQNDFDEAKLKTRFKNLPVIKNLLFEQILQSLYIGRGRGTPLQAIDKDIAYIIILFSRGLHKRALNIARNSFDTAMDNELLERAIVLQSLTEDMTINTLSQKDRWDTIHEFHEQSSNLLQALLAIKKLFFEERKIIHIENLSNAALAEQLLPKVDIKFLENYKHFNTIKERVSLYTSLTFYYKLRNDYPKMYKTSCEGIAFNRACNKNNPGKVIALNYMVAIFNHQHICIRAGDLEGAEREFVSLHSLNTANKHIDDIVIKFHEIKIMQEILYWQGNFKEGYAYSKKQLSDVSVHQNAPIHSDSYIELLGNAALFALLTGKFKESYFHLQQIRTFDFDEIDDTIEREIQWLEAIIHQQSNDMSSLKKQAEVICQFEAAKKIDSSLAALAKQLAIGETIFDSNVNFILLQKLNLSHWLKSISSKAKLSDLVQQFNISEIKRRKKLAQIA